MQLELSEQERAGSVSVLTAAHDEVNTEIHHAMAHETRETFRQRRALLEDLLNRFGAKVQPAR